MQNYRQMPMDELCSLVIERSRSFIKTFPVNEISAAALESGSLRRTLDSMGARTGISRQDDTDIGLLSAVLQRELNRETLGWDTVFDGQIDPEIGAIGEARQIRDLTDRSRIIDELSRSLRRIAYMRSICRARLDAEELIMGR